MIKRLGGIIAFGIVMLAIAGWVNTFQSQDVVGDLTLEVPQQVEELPDIAWLGEGVGTYTVDPGYEFLVKHAGWIEYTIEAGPTYEGLPGERIWSINDVDILGYTIYDGAIDFGTIEAGCLVDYVQIDDDIDDRRNTWYINDNPVQTVEQGMVVYESFVAQETGDLVFFAEDSVGVIDLICPTQQETPTPTATSTEEPPTATPTEDVPTATPTEDVPTATPTDEPPTPTATDTPEGPTATPEDPTATPEDPTATPEDPTATPEDPTATPEDPTATPTDMPPTVTQSPPTPVITATPSPTAKPPREDACLRINFDITGDEAMRGLFVVQEVGGAVYAEWYALDGWQDSGWIRGIDIAYPSVYVQVLYYSGPGADPIVMRIVNPAPGTEYGWLGRGMCHALEVGWPE